MQLEACSTATAKVAGRCKARKQCFCMRPSHVTVELCARHGLEHAQRDVTANPLPSNAWDGITPVSVRPATPASTRNPGLAQHGWS
jgi:hypothetical protein